MTGRFNLEVVVLMECALLDAWTSLSPDEKLSVDQDAMVARIINAANGGERNCQRLCDAALGISLGLQKHQRSNLNRGYLH